MYDEIARMLYTKWCESEVYKEQSSLEMMFMTVITRKLKLL